MSIQEKTGRVRPEIMHIEYKVEVGDAIALSLIHI